MAIELEKKFPWQLNLPTVLGLCALMLGQSAMATLSDELREKSKHSFIIFEWDGRIMCGYPYQRPDQVDAFTALLRVSGLEELDNNLRNPGELQLPKPLGPIQSVYAHESKDFVPLFVRKAKYGGTVDLLTAEGMLESATYSEAVQETKRICNLLRQEMEAAEYDEVLSDDESSFLLKTREAGLGNWKIEFRAERQKRGYLVTMKIWRHIGLSPNARDKRLIHTNQTDVSEMDIDI